LSKHDQGSLKECDAQKSCQTTFNRIKAKLAYCLSKLLSILNDGKNIIHIFQFYSKKSTFIKVAHVAQKKQM